MRVKIPVVFLTCYFPPMSHIAAYRVGSFAKYFDKETFEVHVVVDWPYSVNPPSDSEDQYGNKVYYIRTTPFVPDLTQIIQKNWLLHKFTAVMNKIKVYFFIDDHPDFTAKAESFTQGLVEKLKAKYLVTSFGPRSVVLTGLRIKKKNPDLVWISDMRDEMATAGKVSWFLKQKLVATEKEMMKFADYVSSVSQPMLKVIAGSEAYPEKLVEIRNGFDFEPIESLPAVDGAFRILYAGSFYGIIKPDTFIDALRSLIAHNPSIKLKVDFFGAGNSITIPNDLTSFVESHPRVSHGEILKQMEKSSALLMIHPTTARKGVFTGKLFDYLAVNRLIIGLLDPEDVAAQLISDANAGYVVDYDDRDGIEQLLLKAYREWESGVFLSRNWSIVRDHHRRKQCEKLQKLIETDLEL